jgi:ribosomal protein L37AE/L43A
MRTPSTKVSRAHHLICPFCEAGELVCVGPGFARCGSCGLPLLGSVLETLRDVIDLPEALGAHPCECDHPEMRRLPDGVYHCPACGSEVVPTKTTLDPERAHLGSTSAWNAGGTHHLDPPTSIRIDSEES